MPETMLVVTAEQLAKGYFELINGMVYQRKFMPLRRLDDGNWVVYGIGKQREEECFPRNA